jgi:hypothetical protein
MRVRILFALVLFQGTSTRPLHRPPRSPIKANCLMEPVPPAATTISSSSCSILRP